MTTKPQPLTSLDSDASDKERRLLEAGAVLAPPAGAKDAIWAELAARLPPPGAPGSDGGGLGDGGTTGGSAAAEAGAGSSAGGSAAGTGAAGTSSAIGAGSAAGTSAAGTSSAIGAGSAAGTSAAGTSSAIGAGSAAAAGAAATSSALGAGSAATGAGSAAAGAGGAAVSKGAGLLGIAKTGIVGLAVGLVVAGGANVALNPSDTAEPVATAAPAPDEPTSETMAPKTAAAPTDEEQGEPVAAESTAQPTGRHKGVKSNQTKQPLAAGEESAETPEPAAVDEPVPETTPPPTSAEKRKSQLWGESRLLRSARAALRSGNAASALALLNQFRREFPKPVLGQEHEALVIKALMASGSSAQARQRARSFLKHHPKSTHAAALKKIVGKP